jgi:hypothetical protein
MSSRISLVIIDTETYVLANNAIEQSVRQFPFDDVLVLTDQPQLWPRLNARQIPRITTIEDYNRLVIEVVPEHVCTDHFIIAQYDGFVLDGSAFRPEFRGVDYIGAVWPHFPYFRVGNGGFSWRSRRLAEATARLSHWRTAEEPEDVFVARIARVALETRYGCVFADEALAGAFSIEGYLPTVPTFGFHGLFHLPIVYQNNLPYLIDNLPDRVIASKSGWLALAGQRLDAARRQELSELLARRQAAIAG